MRAIIVDDEPMMLKRFARVSANISDIQLAGQFETSEQALHFMRKQPIEIAFLDIDMPVMDGVELAKRLRDIRPDVVIVFISAYDTYIREFNQIGGDYYILKPYNTKILEMAMERIRLIARRQQKKLYLQMFGRFLVLKDSKPIPLTGKAKEILALVATRRGKEISNGEIFRTIWEGREYSNSSMVVYYNALRRLKQTLEKTEIENLLISTERGQMLNISLVECDYYNWQDKNPDGRSRFDGEFLSEYSWGEYILANIMNDIYN